MIRECRSMCSSDHENGPMEKDRSFATIVNQPREARGRAPV